MAFRTDAEPSAVNRNCTTALMNNNAAGRVTPTKRQTAPESQTHPQKNVKEKITRKISADVKSGVLRV